LKKLKPRDHIKGTMFTNNNIIIAGAINKGPLLFGSKNQPKKLVILFIIFEFLLRKKSPIKNWAFLIY
jgi:hypothetical protein